MLRPLPTIEPPPILIVPTPTPPMVNNQPPPGAVPVPTLPPPPSPPFPETRCPQPLVPYPPQAPAGQGTCPIDSLKLKGCVDRLVRVGIGGTAEEKCCPVLVGLARLDAAVCLCIAVKAKLLDVTVIQVLVQCGNTPPPGFTCP